ncbi:MULTISPECIES: helix-turn-helix domain-containing protein [Actinomadura]|uniref:Helix-turn-helix domain-containing protein n=1 Tax=Actinomadura yumaensis TaxID=111807 RepID=A0ABW2CW85_9ACTN|nr:helix-turn-helix transcriptional regulator [Actinomadura sp. J1-007]MWK35301.1 helix-turn-helix domain-containing protein [Actinomadura sp. J1-007]
MYDGVAIGSRLRALRVWRGMSLAELSGQAGMSTSLLSMIERGQRALDRRSYIAALAVALRVSETEIVGGPHLSKDPIQSAAHGTVPALRLALTSNTLDDACTDYARPLAELAAELAGPIHQAEKRADYLVRGNLLGPVLNELHVHSATGDEAAQRQACALLVQACNGAGMTLRHLNYQDLAFVAAERAREAAWRADDPVLAGRAANLRVHTLPKRGAETMVRIADQAAARLQPHLDEPAAQETYGMLHLSAAMCSAVMRDTSAADEHLAEAAETAGRTGERPGAWGDFGPTNVGIWGVAIATEAGDYEGAVRAASSVNPERLANKERKAMLFADVGRALAHVTGRERDAVAALAKAERIAPQRIRNSTPARHAVEVLLEQARAAAVGRELRGMAARMGVPH